MPRLALVVVVLAAVLGLYLRYSFFAVSVASVPTNTDEALNMLMARDIAVGHRPLLFWTQPYQFPLEAYVLSFFIGILPPDAFGARVVLAVLASFATLGFCLVYRYHGKLSETWPGLILILIPSAYVIVRQTGYTIPQYTSTIIFASLLPLLFVLSRWERQESPNSTWREALWGIPLGFTAGLALSVHLLSLSFVAACGACFCFGKNLRSALRNTALFLPAFALGLIPYLAAMRLPNAYEKVADAVPLHKAVERLWDPIIVMTLSPTFGVNPPFFPDMDHQSGPFPFLIWPFIYFFLAVMLLAALFRLARIIRLIRQRVWPSLELEDLAILTSLLTLLIAAFAEFGIKYRYLLPLAWYFPFVLCFLYSALKNKLWRFILSGTTIGLAILNVHNTRSLMQTWSAPHFAEQIPGLPKLQPLLDHLRAEKITHCYASWWLSYRVAYETSEEIVCTQPMNERFPGWPLTRFKQEVDEQKDSPYILTNRERGEYRASTFEAALKKRHLEADIATVGPFKIFRNFRNQTAPSSTPIDERLIELSVSEQSHNARNMLDHDLESRWTAHSRQPKPWVEIRLKSPTMVHLIRIYFHDHEKLFEKAMIRISAFDGSTWHELIQRSDGLRHRLKLSTEERHLHHSLIKRNFSFSPARAEKIRIERLDEQATSWEIGEIEVFGEIIDSSS